jgi:hypothetical protein
MKDWVETTNPHNWNGSRRLSIDPWLGFSEGDGPYVGLALASALLAGSVGWVGTVGERTHCTGNIAGGWEALLETRRLNPRLGALLRDSTWTWFRTTNQGLSACSRKVYPQAGSRSHAPDVHSTDKRLSDDSLRWLSPAQRIPPHPETLHSFGTKSGKLTGRRTQPSTTSPS